MFLGANLFPSCASSFPRFGFRYHLKMCLLPLIWESRNRYVDFHTSRDSRVIDRRFRPSVI